MTSYNAVMRLVARHKVVAAGRGYSYSHNSAPGKVSFGGVTSGGP